MVKFSESDLKQISAHGLTAQNIDEQLHYFETGFPYSDIIAPATVGNGILDTADKKFIDDYRARRHTLDIVKFVPASGAATRMFKDLYAYLSNDEVNATTRKTLDNLQNFAFTDNLSKYLPPTPTDRDIIECIVTERGLNYGNAPKALIQFHKYNDGSTRTATAEHLIEGALYATGRDNTVRVHFTVSPEHADGFNDELTRIIPEYERKFNVTFNVTMSSQMPETDTIAVNLDNTPFRDSNGALLFRPAGHGALIENLNRIDADIIFIKNIDNICTDKLRDTTVHNKELLAGVALWARDKTYEYIKALDNGTANTDDIREFINSVLGHRTNTCDAQELRKILNRPLRACGMILNTGEPGGGPFWTRDTNGNESLQIVEPGQIAPEQKNLLRDGKYFSPTDLACCVRDYQGNKFDLTKYVDATTGFISEKSKNGRPLRAMEKPGLWNGAMAHWNTIFVVMPLDTFTPVKVITDLLNPTHQGI